jgi:hypothetical protein
VADDGSGSEGITLDVTHQVVINVHLPRHFDWLIWGREEEL